MRTILAAASVLAMMSGAAMAQTTPSTADKPAEAGQKPSADPKQTSPGSTGAMQNEVGGTATSPQDVQKQGGAATAPGHQGDGKSTGGGDKPK
ncbi:hypothetical protein [Methylopila sp. M107]|uniref:hypothetical protein n=1 Tax=Methylopila sp. M107 TaxID=1101190 RepID=UPI00039E4DBE|nr:hypothetical protein [Methylopila sp. M107]